MWRGPVQQRVDSGVRDMPRRIDDELVVGAGCDDMCGVCGWTGKQRVHDGMRPVHDGSVPRPERPGAVRTVQWWVDNGYVEWRWSHALHIVCGRTVQPYVHGGVCAMPCRFNDRHSVRACSDDVHCLCCWPVQQRVDGCVCCVLGRFGHQQAGSSRRYDVHGVRRWSVQQRLQCGMRRLLGWHICGSGFERVYAVQCGTGRR